MKMNKPNKNKLQIVKIYNKKKKKTNFPNQIYHKKK